MLCWPAIASLLDVRPGRRYLDIACGNGLTSRLLAALGAQVTAFDFSANLIEKARTRSSNLQSLLSYHVVDATNEQQLLSLCQASYDAALSNMALFDMADIETLFRLLPSLLKPNGMVVFSLTHPAFNNASSRHVVEKVDYEGEIKTQYSVKISRYMSHYHSKGLALRGQPNRRCTSSGLCNTISTWDFRMDSYWMALRSAPSRLTIRRPVHWGGEAGSVRSRWY